MSKPQDSGFWIEFGPVDLPLLIPVLDPRGPVEAQ